MHYTQHISKILQFLTKACSLCLQHQSELEEPYCHSQKQCYIMDLIPLCHREASAHRICSSILTCEAHTRCHILRVATFCFVCYSFLFPVFFQRVVLLLTESTRWQQNAFKYLLDCHHSLYPFINSVCAPTLKRAYYSYCCILGSLFGDLSHLLHHSYSCQRTIDRV